MPQTNFNHTLAGACENIVKEASDLAGSNYARNLGRSNGALDFLTSPDNGGVQSELITAPGQNGQKLAQLRIVYDQRARPCQASTSQTYNVCNDTAVRPARKQVIKNIGKRIGSPIYQMYNDDLVIICQGSSEFIQQWLVNGIRATKERLNEVLLAEFNALSGKIYGYDQVTTAAGTPKNLQLLYSYQGQDTPQPGNFITINQDFANMQLSGVPAIIGNGKLDRYVRLNKMACCNQSTPYAESVQQLGSAYFYDHVANTVLGTDRFLVIPFGILHMLTFNENRNVEAVLGKGDLGTEIHTVVPDPDGLAIFSNGRVHPVMWDFDMKWDCTNKTWKYGFSFHWDLFNVYQADSFASDTGTPDCTDELLGMTGVFLYKATAG